MTTRRLSALSVKRSAKLAARLEGCTCDIRITLLDPLTQRRYKASEDLAGKLVYIRCEHDDWCPLLRIRDAAHQARTS